MRFKSLAFLNFTNSSIYFKVNTKRFYYVKNEKDILVFSCLFFLKTTSDFFIVIIFLNLIIYIYFLNMVKYYKIKVLTKLPYKTFYKVLYILRCSV